MANKVKKPARNLDIVHDWWRAAN
ncbi:MAG: hypothetical protein QOF79_171, partial [Actinomycetota bacterium]|nr:hypothetical protein [Actinomycetota bacterium]